MNCCRVLLVDDSRPLLEALGRFLAVLPGVEVVGQGCSGPEALEQAARLKPDLVLMDLVLPGMSGLEATRRLKAAPEGPLVVVMTLHDDPEHRAAALAAGADGFLDKRTADWRLPPLVRELFFRPARAARLGPPDRAGGEAGRNGAGAGPP